MYVVVVEASVEVAVVGVAVVAIGVTVVVSVVTVGVVLMARKHVCNMYLHKYLQ